MIKALVAVSMALGLGGAAAPTQAPLAAPDAPRLYAIDCGRAEFEDLGPFSDTGEYDGQPGELMTPCFLIRHPKGDLLWESGLGDHYFGVEGGTKLPQLRAHVPSRLEDQLKALGLDFGDIEYFAFSHGHGDHLGNAARLGASTWLVNRREIAWLEQVPSPPRTNPKLMGWKSAKAVIPFDRDHDVFGDGTVRILAAPGHTPGHQVLMVKLKKSGPVILSGDLYHTSENRRDRRMPIFNDSRAETLASMDRIEKLRQSNSAELIIQHDQDAFRQLPKFPSFRE